MPHAILEHLAQLQPPYREHVWSAWLVRPVASGNNRLFRVTRDVDDWAVKFTIRDDRDRARREFNALTLLDRTGPGLAPRPVHLELDRYDLSVVVQNWIDGTPLWSPPADDATWLQILRAYRRLHSLPSPDGAPWGAAHGPLLIPTTPEEIVSGTQAFAEQIPPTGQSARLSELLQTLRGLKWLELPETRCWAHGDTNIRNLILTPDGIKLVDWEYSGVTDPAHEIAKLMSHSNSASAGEPRWAWVAAQYASMSDEPDMLTRIRLFYALRLAGWCVRLLFGRHVLLQQPSLRLVGHAPEAEMSTPENIDLYFDRARSQLARWS